MSRSRKWVFTSFVITASWKEEWQAKSKSFRYCVVGREECPSTGRIHLQGFMTFKNPMRMNGVKSVIGDPTAHVEVAKGDITSNQQYCKKDGNFIEIGEPPVDQADKGELEKERWKRAKVACLTGDWDSIDEDIFIRCYGSLRTINKDFQKRPGDLDGVCGLWIHGDPGVGKSYRARQLASENEGSYYEKAINKWWDAYDGEPTIIIDDVDTNHVFLGSFLKIWADRYAFIAEIKGGSRRIRPLKIIVTSNYTPELIWPDTVLCAAIRRRFVVEHMVRREFEGLQRGDV